MRMNRRWNAVLLIAGLTVTGRAAKAQLPDLPKFHPSFYGSAEADTRSTQFYLLGMYVGMGGLGWSPYFNINGYLDRYPDGTTLFPQYHRIDYVRVYRDTANVY